MRPLEVVERRRLPDDVRRELEEDPAQLPASRSGSSASRNSRKTRRAQLARRPVDAAALVDRHPLAQVGRQLLELHRMARHQPERLHVHHESGRRPVGPALHHLLGRHAVVGRVDLDRREALRVVGEALARRQPVRVPVLDERLVGPRARADPDGAGTP